DLGRALACGLTAPDLNCYQDAPISPILKEVVAPGWPYPAEAYLSANGGYDAVRLALQTLVMPGSTVAVEDPTAMRVLDILDNLGVHVVPVACDADGPQCASLAEAMKHKPAAFIYQPRTHAVTGRHLTAERLDEMAALLADNSMFLIEDDGLGDISCRPPVSLGVHFPERTVHILSYSKSLGPDLRMAVLSSSSEIVDQIMAYRSFGSRWTSRILQHAVAWLLADPASLAAVANARAVYARRREALVGALQAHGVHVPAADGLCLWLPVPSEQYAMVTLAARGVAVLPGARFCIRSGQYLRIATSLLSEHVDEVAEALALSCTHP
ncbi:MAG TPA: aminotransferase class I/II-fold pyridoxal phosphate-dependent enzyme, partial [Holophaga sp.]|nr:aminotransferase class I/II-fold pyridoxal phosphate-dependent enzyme [Holophaga sp.]